MNSQNGALGGSYEWKIVTLLTISLGLVGLDRWIVAPQFLSMMHDLNLNYQDLGNIIGALGLAWGGAAIFFGGLSDQVGRKRVLLPALIGFSLLSGLMGYATGLVSLLLIRGLMDVTEGSDLIVATQLQRFSGPRAGSTESYSYLTYGFVLAHVRQRGIETAVLSTGAEC